MPLAQALVERAESGLDLVAGAQDLVSDLVLAVVGVASVLAERALAEGASVPAALARVALALDWA